MSSDNHLESAIDCEIIGTLIPDYAFGLTDAEDSRLVESSLPVCLDAAAQLADFRQIQDEMRASVAQLEPPPELAERLMALVNAPVPAAAPVVKRKLQLPPLRPAWVAAVAALLVLVVTNFYWFSRVSDLTTRYNELEMRVNTDDRTSFVLTSTSDLQWVRLPSAEETAKSAAFLMWNTDSAIGVLYASGFPPLEEGKIYQLWLTRKDERISAGTFRVDHYGKGALLFHVTEPIDRFAWAWVTAEPESGSEQPGDTVITKGEL